MRHAVEAYAANEAAAKWLSKIAVSNGGWRVATVPFDEPSGVVDLAEFGACVLQCLARGQALHPEEDAAAPASSQEGKIPYFGKGRLSHGVFFPHETRAIFAKQR